MIVGMAGIAVRLRMDSANILAWRTDDWHPALNPHRMHCGNIAEMSGTSDANPLPVPRASKPIRITRARRTAILKALADPRRFQLLEQIAKARCPLACSAARSALPISAATLSHHIKELEAAGLIIATRDGKFVNLSLRPEVLQGLVDTLASLASPPCPPVPPSTSE